MWVIGTASDAKPSSQSLPHNAGGNYEIDRKPHYLPPSFNQKRRRCTGGYRLGEGKHVEEGLAAAADQVPVPQSGGKGTPIPPPDARKK
jgi:hypothetical protein